MTKDLLTIKLIQECILQPHPIMKPRGAIIELAYNPALTEFNVNDYIKQSKKSRRSEKLEDKIKPVLQYTMVGKCLAFRRKQLNTTFILRNVVDLTSYEMTFALFSPFITQYWIRPISKTRTKYTKGTQYYLRRTAPVKSCVPFDYVVEEIITI